MTPENRLLVVESPGPYIYFVLSAFAITLVAGPLLGMILWASRRGIAFVDRQPPLIQAHGWTQLVGWSGVFVAGFSLSTLPRFAGIPERAARPTLALLAALILGVILRLVGQVLGRTCRGARDRRGDSRLSRNRRSLRPPDRDSQEQPQSRGPVGPARLDRSGLVGCLGDIDPGWRRRERQLGSGSGCSRQRNGLDGHVGRVGNFIWAVQSRMMPISFGRGVLKRGTMLAPALAYNLGTAIALVGAIGPYSGQLVGRWPLVRTAGLGLAGAGMIGLALRCGVIRGQPVRLRPAAQPLARFFIWSNRWVVCGGALLLLESIRLVLPTAVARLDIEDASLHAIEVGLVTMLIAGMLQLVAPVFALERKGRTPQQRFALLVWALLMAATAARVSASVLPSIFVPLAGFSGLSGWLGLALLASALVRTRARTGGTSSQLG